MELLRIDDLADRQVFRLSGGQRQRVFVAQAIAQEHSVLLMDEPLTGLDIHSAQTIDQIIHEEPARGCSVVFTTHDLEEARAADHVILVSGYVVASGPPEIALSAANLATAYGLGLLHPGSVEGHGIIDDAHDTSHLHKDGGG
jgi:manganese transport system ATP-binding protein